MAWVRVDDSFYDHEKFMDVRMSAVGVWLAAMAWCNRHETDGLIPAKVVKRFAKKDEAAELVAAGLWIPLDGGRFQVHGFLDYQPSKASRDEKRARDRSRQAKIRTTSQDVASDSPATRQMSPDVATPVPSRPNPTQVTTPPTPPRGERSRRRSVPSEPSNPVGEFKGYDLPAQPVPPPPNIRSHLRAVEEAS